MMFIRKIGVGLLAVLALAVAGCGGAGSEDDLDPNLLFVNASADAGALDFLMNEVIGTAALAYPTGNPNFLKFEFEEDEPEGYDVAIRAAGTSTEFDRQAIVFNRDTDNIVLAFGQRTIAPGEDIKRLRFTNFTVNTLRPNGNRSRLIVFHGFNRAAGLQTPSITFRNPGDNPQYSVGPIAYGTNSTLDVDAGTFVFQARRSDGEAVYASATLTLQPGTIYLVLVAGIEGDPDPTRQPAISLVAIPSEL